MIKESKELLLKDLCARLQYGVKISAPEVINDIIFTVVGIININSSIPCVCCIKDDTQAYIEIPFTCKILPYLRPISSMTEEEKRDLLVTIVGNEGVKYFQVLSDGSIDNTDATIQDLNKFNIHWINFDKDTVTLYLDWLNAHHFDFRNLIEKGLAIAVTEENNPYEN